MVDAILWRGTQEQDFVDALKHAIESEEVNGSSKVGVLYLRMGDIKRLRGIYGRVFVNELAKSFHDRIKENLRSFDHMQALGNCEFLVCLPRIKNIGHLGLAINKLISELGQEFEHEGEMIKAPPSIGAAIYPDTNTDIEVLINAAEQAQTEASNQGKSFLISPHINEHSATLWNVEEEFRKAIFSDELSLHYQPQIDLHSGQVIGVEALLRWKHPSRGMISPGEFIPHIERTNLIHDTTHWCLHRALREQKEWLEAGHDISISVNIASRNFHEPSFHEIVLNALELWHTPGEKLVLEITESAILDNLQQVSEDIRSFRDSGVKISIDDFGTGYSSLAYLSRLPIDELKIDQSFIKELASQQQNQRIVTAIIQMAREFDLSVLAEGIEDQQSYDLLRDFNCNLGQGYLMARPMPPEDFLAWLANYPSSS